MTEFEKLVLADLAVLKSEMKSLLGNGQPGRLVKLEEKVTRHETALQRAVGIGALGGLSLTLVHLGIDYLRLRH
jgi:hypothetical protein